jgi:stage II sporulation protein E
VIKALPITDFVAATSVGLVEEEELLDLCYQEDSNAIVDMNVVMSSDGRFIEIQATGEQSPFSRKQFDKLLRLAEKGIENLIDIQRNVLGELADKVGRVAKDEKYVSGDNYTFLNSGDGKYIAALSDGMGTGHKACLQSKATVNLIEQFMESGFDKDTTVKLINSILVLKSNDESFATIDISVVDLYDGEVEFVKVGAAPTFIKRADYVETIRAASLPAGILSNVELELIHKNVNNGEYIVMVSDGIVDSFKSSDDSIIEVQNVISQMTSKNPQKIADDLLEEALSRCKDKEPIDDMMVMVSKIWKPL